MSDITKTDQAVPAVAKKTQVPVRLGMMPANIEEGYRLAQLFAASELVPKAFRGKPADALVAIMMGIDIGLSPAQAVQAIAVINGRPSLWGDGFLAVIMASPEYVRHDEYFEVAGARRTAGLTNEDLKLDSTAAVCTFVRRSGGHDIPTTRRFSVAQARKAGLVTKEGPWQSYPDRMLAMRARGFAGRDSFPDALRGLALAEEARDATSEPTAPPPAPVEPPRVQRLSERAPTPTPEPVPITAEPAPPSPIEPLPELTVHERAQVASVQPVASPGEPWYAVIALRNGKALETDNQGVAGDLAKFINTDHALRIVSDGLTIVSVDLQD